MTDKIFDVLRFISECFIPLLVTFLGVVFANFPWPYAEATLAIIGAFGVFLAGIVAYFRKQHNKG